MKKIFYIFIIFANYTLLISDIKVPNYRISKQQDINIPLGLPVGNYTHTCKDCTIYNNVLKCYCLDKNQNYVETKLAIKNPVQNCNGTLQYGDCLTA